MTDRPKFKLHMAARDYIVTWDKDGYFICDDAETQDYVRNLFRVYDAGYSYNATRTLVEFVETLDATWINKPTVPPIELDKDKIY